MRGNFVQVLEPFIMICKLYIKCAFFYSVGSEDGGGGGGGGNNVE